LQGILDTEPDKLFTSAMLLVSEGMMRSLNRIFTFMVLLFLASRIAWAEEPIQVPFASGDWAPFSGNDLPEGGIATEIIKAACKAGGLKPTITFYPWRRNEAMVQGGQAFATFPWARSKLRATLYDYSDYFLVSTYSVLKYNNNPATDNFKFTKFEDFKGFKIGTLAGSKLTELFLLGVSIEETEKIDNSILKLKAQRIAFVIEDKLVIKNAIKTMFPGESHEFSFLNKNYKTYPLGLLISRTYPNAAGIAKKFATGLSLIKSDGTLASIYQKHGLETPIP
jgi:polar amino acid transport system substrate-binding protein